MAKGRLSCQAGTFASSSGHLRSAGPGPESDTCPRARPAGVALPSARLRAWGASAASCRVPTKPWGGRSGGLGACCLRPVSWPNPRAWRMRPSPLARYMARPTPHQPAHHKDHQPGSPRVAAGDDTPQGARDNGLLARRGARPVGVDVTPAQLRTARQCQRQSGIVFPLIEADATDVPLGGASFDLVISECGASLWCDPARWVPKAARLMRPGGRLVFHTTSVLSAMCLPEGSGPAGTELLHPQREVARLHSPRRRRGVSPRPRGLDHHLAPSRFHHRGTPRALCPTGRHRPPLLQPRHRCLGPAMARRGTMGNTPANLSTPESRQPMFGATSPRVLPRGSGPARS